MAIAPPQEVTKMSPPAANATYYVEEIYAIEKQDPYPDRESMQSERQISVDPFSVNESEKSNLHSILSAKSKFLSCSLPSSPLKQQHHKKSNNHHNLARQQSVALSNLERLHEIHLQRSKSCREGRVCQSSTDFDLWSTKTNHRQVIFDAQRRADNEGEVKVINGGARVIHGKGGKEGKSYEDKFKCGAMCLFLPGFGKAKTVRSKYEHEVEQEQVETMDVVSQKVSMEKFECGSWRSSAVINSEEDGDATSNLFFDLPVQLIRCSTVNDTESPVTAAFVFDNKDRHIKGVLKNPNTNGQPRNSDVSSTTPRHVRFSTSSPTLTPTSPNSCVTPRLHKARDEFSIFLDAQI